MCCNVSPRFIAVLIFGHLVTLSPGHLVTPARAQGAPADYERAAGLRARTANKVFKTDVRPNWFANGERFWYRNDLANMAREFILVDAGKGTRSFAFDHEKLAAALAKASNQRVRATHLLIEQLVFDDAAETVRFTAFGQRFSYNLKSNELGKADPKEKLPAASFPLLDEPRATRDTGPEASVVFQNRRAETVKLFWIDTEGRNQSYGVVEAGTDRQMRTFAGHVWLITNNADEMLAAFATPDAGGSFVIDAAFKPTVQPAQRPRPSANSPDGKWTVFVKDNNLHLRDRKSGEEFPLSRDGTADDAYGGQVNWSPDSARLVGIRTKKGDERSVNIIESSPRDQLQPKLQSYSYRKPGDRIPIAKPHLFEIAGKREIPVKDDLFVNPWDIRELRWDADGKRFTFIYNQRGHQVMRVVAVDAQTGEASPLIDEQCKTFFDYAYKFFYRHLDETNEILWMSERDGWNHLYLFDARTGKLKNQITKGEWVVRRVDRVDLKKREIWFQAGGLYADQDPYCIHFCRVKFDGAGLTKLTDGDGTHDVSYSPDGKFLIDSYSRVDQPPITELRRVSDGSKVCELERADASALLAAGFKMPERFVAKARDGKTDIHGVIWRPTNFDASKKYAIIEHIYAGPQGSFVPKRFQSHFNVQDLAELGFIVMQMDGMGTSNRSKAFHDVCWKNLGDAGFPDRILWIKAAAAKYPYMDVGRVGIYGGSAGGQSSTGALLFHPDFYKAAVSDCGCHDNRMDKIWWNELWMSWPVGPHYAEQSNVTNAHKLKGKLLLIVGELDRNVDPASTMQVANALVKAGKDFDLLIVPGAGHGSAESPYGKRRRMDFFVRHLLGVEPPDRNGAK